VYKTNIVLMNVYSCVLISRRIVQVSPMSSVDQGQQLASQQSDCGNSGGLIPLVIDLEDSSETSVAVASISASSMSLTQAVEHPSENLTTAQSCVEPVDIGDHSTAPESTVSAELTPALADPDTTEVAFDLTVARQPFPVTDASVNTADDGVAHISQTSAVVLSDEYRTRYEKYENLCTLITLKDRELAELNDERKRLHQLLVELQRTILTRPVVTAAAAVDGPSTAPPNVTEAVADKDRNKYKEESRQERADVTAATSAVAYRRRPAHRGVTSVRVMVKSTQPPTAHSTKINLLRYNSLFCNYDDAVGRRKPSTEVVVANEDAVSNIRATDLTTHSSERTTKYTDSSEEVVQKLASTAAPEEPYPAKRLTTSFLHTNGEKRSENVDVRYASEARPTTHGRMELVQYQRRPVDDCQTSTALESCPPRLDTAAQNAAVNHGVGPSGAYPVPDDGQRVARQIADAARHQQFVVATTNEMILSTDRGRRDTDDQRPVVLSTMRPEMSLVMSSPGKRRSSVGDVEVPARSICERQELRPPPPYPHHCLENPHPYSTTAVPGLTTPEQAAGVQKSRSQFDHSATHMAAAYMYRKENSAGPRTGYVQPMRAENQASMVLPSSTAYTGREMDVVGSRQPCSDVSSRELAVSEAVFPGNHMSPPAIPLRVGPIRTAYDQTYYIQHVTSDVAQSQPRNDGSYRGNRLSNPQTSRSTSDAVHQQLAPSTANVEQRHVTMTSSSERDVVHRYPVELRPLDQLQHFVGGSQIPSGQQSLDVGDPRLRRLSPPSPRLMISGHLNNADGRSHGPAVGGYYSQEEPAAVPLVRDSFAITEADFARRGAGLSSYQAQAGHSPRFPTVGHCALPPPPSLRRDPSQLQPQPPRGLPLSGTGEPAAAPLDMSGAKHRRYSSLNQVLTLKTVVK